MVSPSALLERFAALYPASARPRVWQAPGRVSLIGEHTDYNLGLVLPMAIDKACFIAAAPSNDGYLRVFSGQLMQGSQWRIGDLAGASPRGDWTDRVAGVAWELARRGAALKGANLLIDSEVPLGSGLSSSAALGVSLAMALGGAREALELAKIARAAEMDFVGVPCGIMDQFIAASGRAGAAILLDCRSLESRAVTLPAGIAIVTANTMVKHELGDGAYRKRVEECSEACRILGIKSLREAELQDLKKLDGVLLKRARHVVTENGRVEAFVQASEAGNPAGMGRLMDASHASLRDDYEVSCEELDFMTEIAADVEGVYGARMVGGGFGGSTVNLVAEAAVPALATALEVEYRQKYGFTPDVHVCKASAGASEIFF